MQDFTLLLPVIFAAILAFVVALRHLLVGWREHKRPKTQHDFYKELLAELEKTVHTANHLGLLDKNILEHHVLANIESNLNMLENVLTSAQKIHPYAGDRYTIQSLTLMARECLLRLRLNQKNIKAIHKGKIPAKTTERPSFPKGCFFCSRPFDILTFKVVSVKLEGNKHESYACKICRNKLHKDKKVKVLHFLQDGKPVHWSELPNYEPSQHFFSLNTPFPEHKKPVLALVYSKKDDNSSSPLS